MRFGFRVGIRRFHANDIKIIWCVNGFSICISAGRTAVLAISLFIRSVSGPLPLLPPRVRRSYAPADGAAALRARRRQFPGHRCRAAPWRRALEHAVNGYSAPPASRPQPGNGLLLPSLPSDQASDLIDPIARRAPRGRRRRASAANPDASTRDRGGAGRGAKRRNRRPALIERLDSLSDFVLKQSLSARIPAR